MTTTKKQAPEKVEVRMPGELRSELVTSAERNNRSVNQQAVHYIERGLRRDRDLGGAIERVEAKLDRILALLDKK